MSSPAAPAQSHPPFVGALLRLSWQAVRARLLREYAAAGFGDITAAHFTAIQYPGPEGARPIDLADRAGVSKQAMNYIVSQLEALGYVERRAVSRRGRLIFLTARGKQVEAVTLRTMRAIESEWAQALGAERFRAFRELLVEVAALSAPPSTLP